MLLTLLQLNLAASGGAVNLVVSDALHAHTADNLTLTTSSATGLTIQDATHAHTADSLALTITGDVESLGGGKKMPTRRIRWQDYDVPLPEPALLPVPPEAKPTPEPAAPVSALAPRSTLAKPRRSVNLVVVATPARARAERPPVVVVFVETVDLVVVAAPAPVRVEGPPVVVAAIVNLKIKPAGPRITAPAEMLATADSMDRDALLQAVKLLARIQIGPQLVRSPRAKLIRQAQ